jgi:hypothetical protein
MKKILLLSALVLAFSANAQITLGPRFGVTFSKQNLESPYEVYKVGTMLGGVVSWTFKDAMAIQAELLLTQKGYREEFDGNNAYDELTAKYLEVPVFFKYSFDFARWKPYANVGGYGAYWRSGTYESKIAGQEVIVEDYEFTDETDSDGYQDIRFDYGVAFGFGLLYDRIGAAGNIVIDFRYSLGLAPIATLENPPPNYQERKNTTFAISLAYMFAL